MFADNFEKRRTVNPMLLRNQIWNLIPKRLLIARPETSKIVVLFLWVRVGFEARVRARRGYPCDEGRFDAA